MAKKRSWGQIMKVRGKWTARWWEGGKLRQKSFAGPKDMADRFLALRRIEIERQETAGERPLEPIRFDAFIARYEEVFAGDIDTDWLAARGLERFAPLAEGVA